MQFAARKRLDKWAADNLAWQPRFRGNYDVVALAHYRAAEQSADFYAANMLQAREFDEHSALIEHAVAMAGDGLYLELGVATGRTITVIANHAGCLSTGSTRSRAYRSRGTGSMGKGHSPGSAYLRFPTTSLW